jgi:dipeptidyl-peptidase-4
VLFSEALIEANKTFDQAYYPNKNHNISGGNTSIQLFTKITNFIRTNL